LRRPAAARTGPRPSSGYAFLWELDDVLGVDEAIGIPLSERHFARHALRTPGRRATRFEGGSGHAWGPCGAGADFGGRHHGGLRAVAPARASWDTRGNPHHRSAM
jgi:hypothetical protein